MFGLRKLLHVLTYNSPQAAYDSAVLLHDMLWPYKDQKNDIVVQLAPLRICFVGLRNRAWQCKTGILHSTLWDWFIRQSNVYIHCSYWSMDEDGIAGLV